MIEKRLKQIKNAGGGPVTLYLLDTGEVKATTLDKHGMVSAIGHNASDAISSVQEQLDKRFQSRSK